MNDVLSRLRQLTPEQRKQFLALLEQNAEQYQIYPLSDEQARMYFLYQRDPANPYYNMLFTLEFQALYSEQVIQQAVGQVFAEQSMLRAIVFETEQEIYQCIMKPDEIPFEIRHVSPDTWQEDYALQISSEQKTPFVLTETVPVRFRLITDGTHQLLITTVHHMFADNWSVGLLSSRIRSACREIAETGHCKQQTVSSYYDYISYQKSTSFSKEKNYWKHQLQDCSQRLHLPEDYLRPKQESYDSETVAVYLGRERSDQIRVIARNTQVSVFSFLLTAFGMTMSCVSGQQKITIGTPVFNRVREQFQKIVGCFANTIAVSMDFTEASLSGQIRTVHKTVRDGLIHQGLPFNQVVDLICTQHDPRITPLYQVMFNLESESVFGNQGQQDDDAIRMAIPDTSQKVQFDLICGIMERNREFQVGFVYKKELFAQETILKIRDAFCQVIDSMLTDTTINFRLLQDKIRPEFKHRDTTPVTQITDRLEQQNTHACFDAVLEDTCLFVSYVSADSLRTDDMLEIIREYTDTRVILIHAFSVDFIKNPEVRMQFLNMAEQDADFRQNGVCQFERNDEFRQEWIWQDSEKSQDFSEKAGESQKINPPSCLDGAQLEEISYHVLADLLCKAPDALLQHTIRTIQYGGAERVMTYAQLLDNARIVAGSLHSRGLGQGSFAVLQIADLYDCITIFWGCQLAGVTAVPLGLPQGLEYRRNDAATSKIWNVCKLLEHAYVIAGKTETANLQKYASETETLCVQERFLPEELCHPDKPETYLCETMTEQDIAVMLFTSGSTGIPKGVRLSHRNIIKRSQGTTERYGFDAQEISLNWMPLDHVGGLVMYHILDVYNHASQIQVETAEILTSPLKWLTLIDRFRVTRTWAPNFAYGLILEEQEKIPALQIDLSCCQFILNGGEAINFTACDAFLKALACKRLAYEAMKPSWGMTETSSGILFSDRFGQIVYHNSVAVGTPNDGVQAMIADADGRPVPQGTTGRLLMAGETINQGYFRNEEENQKCFVKNGWFDTGDYAAVIDGEIVITGRNKDIVIVNGVNITCLEVEKALEELDGVMTGGVACCAVRDAETVNDRVVICFTRTETNRTRLPDLMKEMQTILMQQFSIFADELISLEEEDIPRTAIGKIDKKILVKRYQDHEISGQRLSAGLGMKACMFTLEQQAVALTGNCDGVSYLELHNAEELPESLPQALYYTPAYPEHADSLADILETISRLAEKLHSVQEDITLLVRMPKQQRSDWATVRGYLASLPLEESQIHTILAVTDGSVPDEILIKEFTARENRYQQNRTVFFRAGQRYTEQLTAFKPDTRTDWRSVWNDKTVVILGGLGGVGSLFTQYLVKHCQGRFYLLGRRDPVSDPDRMAVYQKLCAVQPVTFRQCDLFRDGMLTAVLADISAEAGQIDCIVNFTGDADAVSHWNAPESYLIRTQDADTLRTAMRVRRNAMNELAEYAGQHADLHVFLLSSITAIFGGYSFGAYSAVSSELFHRFADHPQFTVIASSKWHDTGMSRGEPEENYLLSERLGFDTLRGEKSAEYLVKLFSAKPGAVLYGLNDYCYQILKSVNIHTGTGGFLALHNEKLINQSGSEALTAQMLAVWQDVMKQDEIAPDDRFFDIGGNSITSIRLIHSITETFGVEISIPALFENPSVRELAGMVAVEKGIRDEPDNAIQERMRTIWMEVLRLETLSPDDKFFEAGGNSLKSIYLISRINEEFRSDLTVVDLFEHPTVRQMAELLCNSLPESDGNQVTSFDL